MARQGSGNAVTGSLIFVVFLAIVTRGAQGRDYNVGGTDGTWTIPGSSNALNYTLWSGSNTFQTDDRLIFKYDPAQHGVYRVTSQAYSSCSTVNPVQVYNLSGSDLTLDVQLEKAEPYYFICPVPEHCPAGQKFMVNVVSKDAGKGNTGVALSYSLSMIASVALAGSFLLFL